VFVFTRTSRTIDARKALTARWKELDIIDKWQSPANKGTKFIDLFTATKARIKTNIAWARRAHEKNNCHTSREVLLSGREELQI